MTDEEIREARKKIKGYSKRDPKTGCHLWTASLRPTGYGQVRWQGKLHQAHRIAYRAFVGEIPDASVVHHTCAVRICVNPKHLQLITNHENTVEMLERTGMKKRIAELEERLSKYE